MQDATGIISSSSKYFHHKHVVCSNIMLYLSYNLKIIIMSKQPVERKSWDEFRKTGLVLIINQILHMFGWAIVFEIDEKGEVTKCYPARVTFRGFDNTSTDEAYQKVSKYMKDNSEELHEETKD